MHIFGYKKISLYFCGLNQIHYVMITTRVQLSPSKRTWEIWYSNDGGVNYVPYKKNLSYDQANKESFIIQRHVKLLKDIKKGV